MKALGKCRAVLAHCLAALVALAAIPTMATASPGDLDQSFGRAGKVTRAANLGDRESVRANAASFPGGGVVVLANGKLYGFAANGSRSNAFAVVKVTDPTGGKLRLADLAADSRGRILVVGGLRPSGAGSSENAFIARYTPRGRPDPSFGSNGFVVTDFGLPGPRVPDGDPTPASQVRTEGVALDPSGRVVLTGSRLKSVGPCRGATNLPYREAFVARLDPDGDLDPSFGDSGLVSLAAAAEVASGVQQLNPPVIDPDGAVYLSTRLGPCEEGRPPLVGHLDNSGRVDRGFGGGGWIAASGSGAKPLSITLDQRGRLLLFAQRRGIAIVKRILPSGTLDRQFGRNGVAAVSGPEGSKLSLAGGAVGGSGRVLIAATSGRSFFVSLLTSSGRIDRDFGRSGWTTTGFGTRSLASATSVTIDTRGRAVVAGTVASPRLPGGDGLALARYLLSG